MLRLLGLLAAIRDGEGRRAIGDEAAQESIGRTEQSRLVGESVESACLRLAREVDVRPFL